MSEASGSLRGGTFDGEGCPSSNELSLHHDSSFAELCSPVWLLRNVTMFSLPEGVVARVLPLSPNFLSGILSRGLRGNCECREARPVPSFLFAPSSSEVFASDQDEAVVVVAKISVDGLSLL